MNICLFEDSGYKTLLPLVYHRPVYDLICGSKTIGDRILGHFETSNVTYHSRRFLKKRVQETRIESGKKLVSDQPILFVNGRIILDKKLAEILKGLKPGQGLVKDQILIGASIPHDKARRLLEEDTIEVKVFDGLDIRETEGRVIQFLWELVQLNGKMIKEDLTTNSGTFNELMLPGFCHKTGDYSVVAEGDVKLFPGIVFDTSKGPIGLSSGVTIKANAVLEGPLFIGKNSIINSMTRIGDATIDQACKVGGEIHSTIMHAFSNKQHDGFLGDAYLGSWVNLGAGTNNSNLKNDYGNIQVLINGKRYDSNSQFVGLLIGDHSKSGIGSLFNTGTVIGTNCNIFGGGLPPQELPSFTWGSAHKRFTTYRLDKALRVAEIVMKRRDQNLTPGEKEIFQYVYQASEAARNRL